MKENYKNMKGQLEIMKTLGIKPNFSELERTYGINRHTIKKYYEGYEGSSPTRNKTSKIDPYYNEIKTKIELAGVNIMSLYQYFYDKDNKIGTYSNFKKYLKKQDMKQNQENNYNSTGKKI